MADITSANTGLEGEAVGRISTLFYFVDGAVGSLDPNWLQDANQHLCNLFRNCVGLKPNTKKTEVMICHPGSIRGQLSSAGYKRRHKDTGETYSKRRCIEVQCHLCHKILKVGSLQTLMRRIHGRDISGATAVEPAVEAPRSYKLQFKNQSEGSKKTVDCPVEECRFKTTHAANLRQHFYNQKN